ncbi:very low-density lipoprotein receptor-like [Panonychus citri]|uniref:very low-density lipoprotein receptor-like n=1 Tax=Panonychus citri TaxID=50023 RepID=UPI002306F9ED|nr:very low-density lipoprotein receptor-like [Panonychus citri]
MTKIDFKFNCLFLIILCIIQVTNAYYISTGLIDEPSIPKSNYRCFARCDYGSCITRDQKCDGISDCYDGSDERNCVYRPKASDGSSVSCEQYFKICNDLTDCKKLSFKTVCSRCSEDTFSCNSKICIPKNWKCDKIVDCPNGEDEKDCKHKNCTPTEFQCGNDRCIDESLYCNGVDDCGDRSDEKSCSNKTASNNFNCRRLYIPSSWHCDGLVDCYNGLDEKNCPTILNCTENQFKCDNRKCIHVDSVCDGIADCWDRSDENNCDQTKCSYNQFDCGDTCIPLQWRCDSQPDCSNSSDELNCHHYMYKSLRKDSSLKCPEGTFPCADKSGCISIDLLCDKHPNCKDYSDEKNCLVANYKTSGKKLSYESFLDLFAGPVIC